MTRIRVTNVPLSADDGQIHRYLEHNLGLIIYNYHRERLRVDGLLTNCQTGDRIFHCEPPKGNIPRYIIINKYHANLIYKGQKVVNPWKQNITCNKCFEKGHKLAECTNEWKYKLCGKSWHKSDQCEEEFESEEAQNTEADSLSEAVNAQFNAESLT